MIDYTIFYKNALRPTGDWSELPKWDVFISAFDSTERVRAVYDKVSAQQKHWLVMPDHGYSEDEWPDGDVFAPEVTSEADFVLAYVRDSGVEASSSELCIDITGFVRPYMMFLLKWLMEEGVKKVDLLYSEPDRYVRKEETRFSDENVLEVRQVRGFEGSHTNDVSNDLLVIGVGYDHELLSHVAESKARARKIELLGLPSLRPDMYQESVLRATKAAEAVGGATPLGTKPFYAPAYDPFVTASVLQHIEREESAAAPLTNLYLCSMGTKPQSLGFTLYYLTECQGKAVSMLYPICRRCPRETSIGISRVWKYTVEFP